MHRLRLFILLSLTIFMFVFASSAHAAVITCTGGTCNGTDKQDTITGSPVYDDIYGKSESDTIIEFNGGGVDDRIQGGSGWDTITDNADPIDGDEIIAGNGSDTINVDDPGDHVLIYYPGFGYLPAMDSVDCGDGTDTVYADTDDIVSQVNCETVIRNSNP